MRRRILHALKHIGILIIVIVFHLDLLTFFVKGNPFYKTDFHVSEKYIFFDDLTFFLGIGFLANIFPRQYEKRLAFIFPATSFQVTFRVEK